MATQFAGNLTTGAVNTPVSIASLLLTAGYTGASGAIMVIIQPTGAGNLVISSDAAIEAEAAGFLIAPTLTFPSLTLHGTERNPVQLAELYLLSATESKTFSLIVNSVA